MKWPEIQEKTFGGRTPPGPSGSIQRSPGPLAEFKGVDREMGKGEEGKEEMERGEIRDTRRTNNQMGLTGA